jgi:hypothetical protein
MGFFIGLSPTPDLLPYVVEGRQSAAVVGC